MSQVLAQGTGIHSKPAYEQGAETKGSAGKVDLSQIDCRRAVSHEVHGEYPIKINCREPGHRDAEASCAVYRGSLTCYGCGFHISRRLDVLSYLLQGTTACAAVHALIKDRRRLAGYLGTHEKVQTTQPPPLYRGLVEVYEGILWGIRKDRLVPLFERGLNEEILRRSHIGHNGRRWTIPVYGADGTLLTIRSRRDDFFGVREEDGKPIPKYRGTPGRNGTYLYPENFVTEACRVLYLVEGEFDALRMWQENIPALTITNGASQLPMLPALIRDRFRQVRYIVVVGDMDEPGQQAAQKTEEEGKRLGFTVGRLSWPVDWGKDITEVLLHLPAHEVLWRYEKMDSLS